MSHRASMLVSRVLPVLTVALVIASPGVAHAQTPSFAPTVKVAVTVGKIAGDYTVDAQPPRVVLCPKIDDTDCSNEIEWTLVNNLGGEFGPDHVVQLVYKPKEPEPFLPIIFQEDVTNAPVTGVPVLELTQAADTLHRTVRPEQDWFEKLGNPQLVVWRYDVVLTYQGKVLARLDPRVIIDRTR